MRELPRHTSLVREHQPWIASHLGEPQQADEARRQIPVEIFWRDAVDLGSNTVPHRLVELSLPSGKIDGDVLEQLGRQIEALFLRPPQEEWPNLLSE